MLLIRITLLSFVFIISLFANVKLTAPSYVIKGEPLVFYIEASGNDIVFPDLKNINNTEVQEISSSSSAVFVNSKVTRKIKKTYSLYTQENITIPQLEFLIDGDKFYTKEKNIEVSNAKKTKSNIFDLSIKASNSDLFVGENFILTLVFKYKRTPDLLEMNLVPPTFKDFWSKQLNDAKQYEENGFFVQELNFLLFPLKEGNVKISPVVIQAIMLDNRRNSMSFLSNATKALKIYSNELEFNIKKLPSNTKLIGNFSIKSSVDKTQIKKGDALSYKLQISGNGNIDDLEDIKLQIPNATIYENKPKIKSFYKDGKYQGVYEKVYSIIPSEDITIPSIKLEYFNKDLQQVVLKQTQEYKIKVDENTAFKNSASTLQKKHIEPKTQEVVKIVKITSIYDKVLYFMLGVIFILLILGLYLYVIKSNKNKELKDYPLLKKVKNSKSKDELLKCLAKYINVDPKLDELIFTLEKTDDIKELKKQIIQLLKNIKI